MMKAYPCRKSVLFAILSSSWLAFGGTTYYVSTRGSDNEDGLTPETALATAAEAFGRLSQDNDGICFVSGTREEPAVYPLAESVTVAIKGVSLSSTSGNPVETVLDGQGSSRGVIVTQNSPTVSGLTFRRFKIESGVATDPTGAALLLKGYYNTVSDCVFAGCTNLSDHGGALSIEPRYVNHGDYSVKDCVFEDCYAAKAGGGATLLNFRGNIAFRGCCFNRCHSARAVSGSTATPANSYGGALYLGFVDDYTVLVTNCSFTANSAAAGGAALSGKKVVVIDCGFTNNVSSSTRGGGAVLLDASAGASIVRCSFSANTNDIADAMGGALVLYNPTGTCVTDCMFDRNVAKSGGGAIYVWGFASPANSGVMSGCEFVENSAEAYGGACHGLIPAERCLFKANRSKWGGAVYLDKGEGCVLRCAFSNNTAAVAGAGGNGGAMYVYGGEWAFTNCVFAGNSAVGDGAAAKGGAVYLGRQKISQVTSGRTVFSDCRFLANTAYGNVYSLGGAVCAELSTIGYLFDRCRFEDNVGWLRSGAVETVDMTESGVSGEFRSCLFTGNEGLRKKVGSGVSNVSTMTLGFNVTLRASTVASNVGVNDNAAVDANAGSLIVDSIVWGNHSTNISNKAVTDADIHVAEARAVVDTCFKVVNAFEEELLAGGCLKENPRFMGGDDFRLASGSPCLGRAEFEEWMRSSRDLDGRKRFAGSNMDWGAYQMSTAGLILLFR